MHPPSPRTPTPPFFGKPRTSPEAILPPSLRELVRRTCRLAAGSPNALELLHDALLDVQTRIVNPGTENHDPNPRQPNLTSSPSIQDRLSFLDSACADEETIASAGVRESERSQQDLAALWPSVPVQEGEAGLLDLVGEHIRIYCFVHDVWRTAVVTTLLPDGAHELVYLCGFTERTVLAARIWRKIS